MKTVTQKIYLLILLTASLTSCKKQYSCRCVTTISSSNYNASYNSSPKKISQQLTKDQAQAVCAHEADNVNQTYINYATNNGNWTTLYSFNTGCIVEQ